MESISRYINHVSRLAAQYRERELKKYNLGPMHHTYILNICRCPGITQEELAKMIFVNRSNVARQLAVLEERGYVRREVSQEDARKLLVFPTEQAEAVRPAISDILKRWNDGLLADFSDERQKELVNDLIILQEKAQELLTASSAL